MVQPRLFIFFLLLSLAGVARNNAHGAPSVLTIGFDIGSPPFFDLKNGCSTGIYPSIVGAIFQDAGQAMIAYPAPFNRILVKLDSGEWGAGGILKTPERAMKYDFTDPIYTEKVVIYYNKIKSRRINTMADLEGERVGIVRGWSYGSAIDDLRTGHYFFSEPVNTDLSNFKKLKIGRIDALLTIEDIGLHLMSSGEFADLATSGLTIQSSRTYIALSKKSDNLDLLRRLNKSIKKLQDSGQIAALVKQYLKNPEKAEASRSHIESPKNFTGKLSEINCASRAKQPVP